VEERNEENKKPIVMGRLQSSLKKDFTFWLEVTHQIPKRRPIASLN
jgi:hypothetical protein